MNLFQLLEQLYLDNVVGLDKAKIYIGWMSGITGIAGGTCPHAEYGDLFYVPVEQITKQIKNRSLHLMIGDKYECK